MKKIALEFVRRGLVAGGFGPVILAVVYWILMGQGLVEVLSVREVCLGILTLYILAFLAGGMNVIYQVERLPLMVAILIHSAVLYSSYLGTYLLNGWLKWGITPLLVFTGVFVFGYLAIWAGIYAVTKRRTAAVNAIIKGKQQLVAAEDFNKE